MLVACIVSVVAPVPWMGWAASGASLGTEPSVSTRCVCLDSTLSPPQTIGAAAAQCAGSSVHWLGHVQEMIMGTQKLDAP
jgi:hypothetical protein